MGGPHIQALKISPNYTSEDWLSLNRDDPCDWEAAALIVKDRLDGRFLYYAGKCLGSPDSGFVVLSIHCLLLETLQQFIDGIIDGHGKSKSLVKKFLQGTRFQPFFDELASESFYSDIRCGLLHQAEARDMWLIRRGERALLSRITSTEGYILDIQLFHEAVGLAFNDYLDSLRDPNQAQLRKNLWVKMNNISNVRAQRGALLSVDD